MYCSTTGRILDSEVRRLLRVILQQPHFTDKKTEALRGTITQYLRQSSGTLFPRLSPESSFLHLLCSHSYTKTTKNQE